jgi:lipopolysaccharide export system protein LptA
VSEIAELDIIEVMKVRNPRSIVIIFIYVLLNVFILLAALKQKIEESQVVKTPGVLAPEYTEIENLNYFHIKEGIPQMSLAAVKMRSQGEERAEFTNPKGIYNSQNKNLNYEANEGTYRKAKDLLVLVGKVRVFSTEAEYLAEKVKYFFKKDLILGSGGVTFKGMDLKTKDQLEIQSETMRARPQDQFSHFKGHVQGSLQRKKKYEGKMTFSSNELQIDGIKSLAHLEGDVNLKRQSYLITAGKGDIYLENFNKSLKYFVFNDDVKVTETMQTPQGPIFRKAFAERLEGFGREQKMVLSGAPKVEHGDDVVKGYRITIRENMDLIEVDDAMSDVKVKREENKKEKN